MKNLLLLLCLSATALSQTPVLSFDCTKIPTVCTNMCWGVHCTGGKWSAALTYDKATKAVARGRRAAAGCEPRPNRCSIAKGYPAGHNCDEFPFASTKEADRGGQSNRCVIATQNTAQGVAISTFLTGRTSGYAYHIAFLSPTTPGVNYCINNGAKTCTNDGNEFTKAGLQANPASFTPKRDGETEMQPTYLYRVTSGRELSSPTLFEVGREIHMVVARNETAEREGLEGRAAMPEAGFENYSLETERIVERLA